MNGAYDGQINSSLRNQKLKKLTSHVKTNLNKVNILIIFIIFTLFELGVL